MKPCENCLTLEEFQSRIEKEVENGNVTFIVNMWYQQAPGYEPDDFNIIYEYNYHGYYVWDWDWDEGGEAYILGYAPLQSIDIAGRGI